MSINCIQNPNINSIYPFLNLDGGKFCDENFDSIFNNIKTEETEKMNVIAHRGYSSIAPENTMSAFKLAAENGYETVECDIEWTKDNVPVLLHDSTINRTARNKFGFKPLFPKKCSNMTYDELLKYDFGSWFSKDFKGEKIPTLNELLDCSKNYDLNLYLELKETAGFDENKVKILVDSIKEKGLEDKVTFISFNEDYLKMITESMPEVRIGYLTKKTPTTETIDTLKSLQTGENEVFLNIKSSKISKTTSDILKDSDFSFEGWTVDDKDDLDELASYDCEAITTNKITNSDIDDFYEIED